MKKSISQKFTLAMVALAVGGIILAGILTNLSLNWNFQRYLRSTQEAQNQRILETLAELYGQATSWQAIRLSTWHVGTTTDTQIRVFDMQNNLIADALTDTMQQGMHGRRQQAVQEQRGNTYSYTLQANGHDVGIVEITHLGQVGLMSGEALVFSRTVNQAMLLTSLGIIFIAALIGRGLSHRLTGRLGNMTDAAEQLGSGEFATRVEVEGDDELAVLGRTMNRMAVRLEEQTALRKKLTGDISHELRTPLTTIQSYIEAFLDKVMTADDNNLQAVLDETHRLTRLVDDLQELSNAQCRDHDVCLHELDLNKVVEVETERTRALFKQKGIELAVVKQDGTINCRADEVLLGRVLGNLLVNAWKYTPQGGKVTVSTSGGHGEALVTVSDTGAGIDKEHLPYIFERFYRADPSRARTTGGSGIGLAIVLELVQAMGGSIDVESVRGEGSTFRVTLQA